MRCPWGSLALPPSSGRPRRGVPTAPFLLRLALTLLLTHLCVATLRSRSAPRPRVAAALRPRPRRLRRLLRWALPVAGFGGEETMKRGFFGTSSPRTSASAAAPEAAAADDDDAEGLELPKNRRRLPKKARASAARRVAAPLCHASRHAFQPQRVRPCAPERHARAAQGADSPLLRPRTTQLVHEYEPVAELCRSQGLPAPPAGLSNVGNRCVCIPRQQAPATRRRALRRCFAARPRLLGRATLVQP